MLRSQSPPTLSFLADRTAVSYQLQNMPASPLSPKMTHNPYSFSVIPENPDEVMFHRSLTQMHDAATSPYSPVLNGSLYDAPPFVSLDTLSPLVPHRGGGSGSPYGSTDFAPVYGSFSASPYQEAAEVLSIPPPLHPHVSTAAGAAVTSSKGTGANGAALAGGLTKVYVGGRPMAVPSGSSSNNTTSSHVPSTVVVHSTTPTTTATTIHAPSTAAPTVHTATATQTPVVEEPLLTKDVVLVVAFRRSDARFALRDVRAVFGCAKGKSQMVGRYVIVEGDRGDDLGRVTSVQEPAEKEDVGNMAAVKRLATRDESARWETTLRQEESRALEFAQQQVARLFPNDQLQIEDATFQFDKQKLTLWYRVPDRVYFVPLLKSLNQMYRCRIWMERLESEATK